MKAWMYIIFAYVAFSVVFGIADLSLAGSNSTLNTVVQFDIFTQREFDLYFFSFTAPFPNFAFFSAVRDILTFNYAIFAGDWNMVRYMVLLVISAGGIFLFVRDIAIPFISALRGG